MWLRIFLLSGLVLHKVIWEIWKRKNPQRAPRASLPFLKRAIKLTKIALLLFFLVQTLFLDVLPIQNPHPLIRPLGIFLFVAGLLTAIGGRVHLGNSWSDLEDSQVPANQMLVTKGFYRYIRHPIYAGDMLLVLGLQLALQSWLFLLALAIIVVTVRQSMTEERLLANSFPEYSRYCEHTKRFLPFLI